MTRRRTQSSDFGGGGYTVFQQHSLLQAPHSFLGEKALNPDQVGFVHLMTGVRQPLSQFPIIGHQQQALGGKVQPPDGEKPRRDFLYQLVDYRPSLRITTGDDVTDRFVQEDVMMTPAQWEWPAIHLDTIDAQVSTVPQ
jgi:hypothetical protein